MNKQTGFTLPELIIAFVVFLAISGWIANVYRLANLDFEPNYKAEIFRVSGVVFPPVGVILGYIRFDEEKPN
jgi:prepilin-type N-terminal cleavage/methylation domain-containing protein